jgi:hypothetical protein
LRGSNEGSTKRQKKKERVGTFHFTTECSRGCYLGSDGVGTGREELGDTGGVETSLSETEGGTETGTTGTDDEGIVGVVDNGVL